LEGEGFQIASRSPPIAIAMNVLREEYRFLRRRALGSSRREEEQTGSPGNERRAVLEKERSLVGFGLTHQAGRSTHGSLYPPCTSVAPMGGFWRFCRLIESVTCGFSTPLLVRSPPPLPILTETKTFTPPSQQFAPQSAIDFQSEPLGSPRRPAATAELRARSVMRRFEWRI
jgi:hypothetical protein